MAQSERSRKWTISRHTFQKILPLGRTEMRQDLIAGITLAAVAIPQSLGYAKIAGMPLVTGLYTLLLPVILFIVFCSSRYLSVGADSSTASILAAGMVGVVAVDSSQYVPTVAALTLLVGALLLTSRLLKLGFIADFLSATAMIGFLTGVGIDIAIAQVPGMFGITSSGNSTVERIVSIVSEIDQVSMIAITIATIVVIALVLLKRVSKGAPDMLIAVIGAIVISWALNLQSWGAAVVGPLSGGLPSLSVPSVQDMSVIPKLSATVASLFLVVIAKSASISRSYASRFKERLDEDADIMGLSAANIGAAFTGTFVTSGSAGKTEVMVGAGGRGQFTQLVMVAIVVIVLLFLTAPLSYLPEAALSGVVFIIGVRMIDWDGLRNLLAKSKAEFAIALITILAVVIIGVGNGIMLAIVISLLYHVSKGYRPKNAVLVLDEHGHLHPIPVSSHRMTVPGMIIYRFNTSMYYANSTLLQREIDELVSSGPATPNWLCFDMSAVSSVDVTAGMTISQALDELKSKGIKTVFADADPGVVEDLDHLGIISKIGRDDIFESPEKAIEAYRKSSREHIDA